MTRLILLVAIAALMAFAFAMGWHRLVTGYDHETVYQVE